jgi:hypothetical protein
VYERPKSIFEELEEHGYDAKERLFPWFIVFDMEALLIPLDDTDATNLTWTHKHQPISVSINSNVPGFSEVKCIVDTDVDALMSQMVDYMHTISDATNDMARTKWSGALKHLESLLERWEQKNYSTDTSDDTTEQEAMETAHCEPPSAAFLSAMKKPNSYRTFQENLNEGKWNVRYNDWSKDESASEDEMEMDEEAPKDAHSAKLMLGQLYKLRTKLDTYCRQTPVLGFNSSNYDLNLIKAGLAKTLKLHEPSKGKFTVKRNNQYVCIASEKLKFLDLSQFLAAGTSYQQFLTAYEVEEKKGYFPYEWFLSSEQLMHDQLPPYDAFYSSLKKCNTLEEDTQRWQQGGEKGPAPKSGVENYEWLKKVWTDRGMKNIRDFLIWYNNLDVGPFTRGVEKLQKFYFDKGIDVFKISISLPGVARSMIFKHAIDQRASFALCDARNKDLHQTIKRNIVGGPSIIFTREHKAGVTYIRENPNKPCKRIIGLDANALYLSALAQPMPTGTFVRWKKKKDKFTPHIRDQYMLMFAWMDWLNEVENKSIIHRWNNGHEKRVGPYLVDGYDVKSNTVYELNGCHFHGHKCQLTDKRKSPQWEKKRARLYDRTVRRADYLREEGYNVKEIWECEFRKQIEQSSALGNFVSSRYPQFYRSHKHPVSEQRILQAVKAGELFGMVEVDLQVPEKWSDGFSSQLSPHEYFREMSPIFCTTDIPFDAIGKHMQDHIRECGLSQKPRRLLVGGMKARKILLATPLLRWYMEHGMQITRVYQAVESRSQSCFNEFADEVSDARRNGDKHPNKKIISDTMKLLGNASYGSLLMNQEKFQNVTYVKGPREAGMQVNDSRFRSLTELDDDVYEVTKGKKSIVLSLPTQLGFFVLQYAKLRMLQFYYDFMDRFVSRADFEYCEMDTDSAYMAISAESLDDIIIKGDREDEYKKMLMKICSKTNPDAKPEWFPRRCCPEDAAYDLRTPGLFKLEFEGDEIIGLCSKTFIVINENRFKYSCKGANKRNVVRPPDCYRSVLHTKRQQSVINQGFRAKDNTMFTYHQKRCAFVYLYTKRRVLDDGIHTVPLDLELCPEREELKRK